MKLRDNIIVGFGAALFFALLYIAEALSSLSALSSLEDRLYDVFLRFRANRQRVDSVAFLDVDEAAILSYGIFPWPRTIPAEGLLRLKEYNSRAGIFDIEYLEKGHQGVDSLYLEHRLENDFKRGFAEITSHATGLLKSIEVGKIKLIDIGDETNKLQKTINEYHEDLLGKARLIALDEDIYLSRATTLFGRTWSTLNLREDVLTEQEYVDRRPIAEDLFSYPVKASDNAHSGAGFVDILPALPMFSQEARGAGFTNVEIDDDGVRRRVYLTQKIDGYWYLQLSFAPLIDYFGRPEIQLEKNRLTIKQARFPDGRTKDIKIPLDSKGRMMLDWPKTDFRDSYTHISFADFSLLDDIERELELYSTSYLYDLTEINYFIQYDSQLERVQFIINDLSDHYEAARLAKKRALEYISASSFDDYLASRGQVFSLLQELISLDIDEKVMEIAVRQGKENPGIADLLIEEAEYLKQFIDGIKINYARWNELNTGFDEKLGNKFVIMGRSDTGTSDYGANPFFPRYVNVGTHGVVLDTILSESFITPIGFIWRVILLLVFIPSFIIATNHLSPVKRALLGFAVTLVILIGSVLLLRFTGIYWGPLGAVFAMIIAIIAREIISYAGSEKEKAFIRNAFSTYLSDDVVKEIISDPSRLQLGGASRYMTAIFTDVKGFSTISEALGDPEKLVSLLNQYLSAMSDVVLAEKGTIDKYEGDAIIAFFGAPNDLPDHALRACVSAIKMKKIETELNKTIMEQNLSPTPLLTRIGINTGNMVVGNMGTAKKMNYTMMGNAVNLSARLEGVNKQYGTWILSSEDTVRETGDALLYRKLDRVRVVGINEPVRLCELIDMADAASEQNKKLVKVFHEALDHFEGRRWKEAIDGFNEALSIKPDDTPSIMYLDRLKQFSVSLPDDSWDGVYNLTSK